MLPIEPVSTNLIAGVAHFLVFLAEATYGYGDFRHNCKQCTGFADGGELLLEVYRVTVDTR